MKTLAAWDTRLGSKYCYGRTLNAGYSSSFLGWEHGFGC